MQAIEDPLQTEQEAWKLELDNFFMWVYVAEAALKIMALGFIWNDGAYLRDGWSQLDFTIVITSLISYVQTSTNLSALRALRILRPLRTVSKVESLKNMLNAIFSSFSTLKDILLIMFFYYTLYAIAGQQVFKGVFKQQCFQATTVYLFI